MIFCWNLDNFALIYLRTVAWGFLRSLITNLRLKPQNSKWRIQYGGQVRDFLVKLWQFCSNLLENGYLGVFEVSDYESEVRILKFKMAVVSKIMYLARMNIAEKVYANKFQLETTKKWFMTRKMKNPLQIFQRINMGLCEFYQNLRYETAISDFQSLSVDL